MDETLVSVVLLDADGNVVTQDLPREQAYQMVVSSQAAFVNPGADFADYREWLGTPFEERRKD